MNNQLGPREFSFPGHSPASQKIAAGRLLWLLPFLALNAYGVTPANSGNPEGKTQQVADGKTPEAPSALPGRSQRWRQRRHDKLQKSSPPQPPTWRKALLQLEEKGPGNLLSYKDFTAQLGSIRTGGGFAGGMRYWRPNIQGSALSLRSTAAYSVKHYQLYHLQFGRDPRRRDDFIFRPNIRGRGTLELERTSRRKGDVFLYADLLYRDFPEEDFFGLGPDTNKADQTDYRRRDASYAAVLGYQLTSWLNAASRVGYTTTSIDPGEDERFPDTQDLFNEVSAPGLARQPHFLHLATGLLIDFRDRPRNPHRGGMLGFSFSRWDDRGSEAHDFNRFAIDGRYFATLGSDQRVLAFRFYTSIDDEDPDSLVPFYLQETLGGDVTLRGFDNFRFRDNNLLYTSLEYRWEASPAVELALFYDRGKVFSKRSDFDFSGLEKSFGFGVRLKTPESVILRLDFARSREDSFRFHFKAGRSF